MDVKEKVEHPLSLKGKTKLPSETMNPNFVDKPAEWNSISEPR